MCLREKRKLCFEKSSFNPSVAGFQKFIINRWLEMTVLDEIFQLLATESQWSVSATKKIKRLSKITVKKCMDLYVLLHQP